MSHSYRDDHVANTCSNPYISEILERRLSRRAFVQAAGAAAALAAVPFVGCASIQSAAPGFRRIEPSTADDVSVPPLRASPLPVGRSDRTHERLPGFQA